MDWEKEFQNNFKCPKCQSRGAVTKELAMTGTGLSKLLDIQMNHYLFVSCSTCGYTEVYNTRVLNQQQGQIRGMDILDFLFGG